MTNFAKTALTALALIAGGSAALATQGDKITAMGYGQTIHHAKMVTIQSGSRPRISLMAMPIGTPPM